MLSIAALLLTACAWGAPPPASRRIVAGLDPSSSWRRPPAPRLPTPSPTASRPGAATPPRASRRSRRTSLGPEAGFPGATPAPACARLRASTPAGYRVPAGSTRLGPGRASRWRIFASEQARLAPEIEKLKPGSTPSTIRSHRNLHEAGARGSYHDLSLTATRRLPARWPTSTTAPTPYSRTQGRPDPDHRSFLADDSWQPLP